MNISLIVSSKITLTSIIAILGVYIAYQQWITSERKRKQDLYEMRRKYLYSKCLEMIYKVPKIAKKIINEKLREKDIIIEFARNRLEYRFLISEKDDINLEKFYIDILKKNK